MADVFISHSSRNSLTADALKEKLAIAGITSWKAPEDIGIGQTWEDAIASAITGSTVFVLLWSGESQNSLQVKRELSLAASMNKIILPLRIDPVAPSGAFAYYLTNTHWRDFSMHDIDSVVKAIKSKIPGLGQTTARANAPSLNSKLLGQANSGFYSESDQEIADALDAECVINVTASQARLGHIRTIRIGIDDDSEKLDVRIPAGVKSGTRLRLKGKGNRGVPATRRGDLYLIVNISEKPLH